METALLILQWIANVEGYWRILNLVGLPWVARWLHRRMAVIRGPGFRFFADRGALARDEPNLGGRLEGIEQADALWVVGQKFYTARINTHIINKLILPNPNSASFKFYCKSVDQEINAAVVAETTRKARKAGAKVRWCDQFLCQSLVLADANQTSGWVHVEIVLPYSLPEKRSGFTVYRKRMPGVVAEWQRVFNELWDDSAEPSEADLQAATQPTTNQTPETRDDLPSFEFIFNQSCRADDYALAHQVHRIGKIGIRNTSKTTSIEDVSVKLVNLKYGGKITDVDRRLLCDDTGEAEITLHPGATEYFTAASITQLLVGLSENADLRIGPFTNGGIETIPWQSYRMKARALGKGVPTEICFYKLEVSPEGNFIFEPWSGPGEAQ